MAYRIVLALYGLINIAGGIMAFMMVQSKYSLIVGGIAGLLFIGMAVMAAKKPGLAFRAAAALCIAMAGFWIFRIQEVSHQGKSTTMAVMNLALAILVFVILGAGHMFAMRGHKPNPSDSKQV